MRTRIRHRAGRRSRNREEGEDRIRASYRDNYDRLAEVKAKYDPENFFRVNQNIKPASPAGDSETPPKIRMASRV